MSTTLWIVTGILAFFMLAAGSFKALVGKDGLAAKMPWVEDFNDRQVRLIGVAEVLGAIGLTLPPAAGVLPILSPIAAACLAPLMLGASFVHFRRAEMASVMPPLVLCAVSGYLAYVGLAL